MAIEIKQDGGAIQFKDCDDHYELIFTDDFIVPSSGSFSSESKSYTLITNIVNEMRKANHEKELHVFIASFGGHAHALNMMLQQVLEFKYRVSINLGMADSAGWMLMFACQERYGSPFSEYMYHEMSGFECGKNKEIKHVNEFCIKWWDELLSKTDTRKVLTGEELKLGETTEVYFTGAELISRGAIKDYAEYTKRKIPSKTTCWKVGDDLYMQEDGEYVKYVKSGDKTTYANLVEKARDVKQETK